MVAFILELFDHNVYCLDAQTGALIWKYVTDGAVVSSAAVVEGIVYIGSNRSACLCASRLNG